MSSVLLQKVLLSLALVMGRPRADPQKKAARSLTSIAHRGLSKNIVAAAQEQPARTTAYGVSDDACM